MTNDTHNLETLIEGQFKKFHQLSFTSDKNTADKMNSHLLSVHLLGNGKNKDGTTKKAFSVLDLSAYYFDLIQSNHPKKETLKMMLYSACALTSFKDYRYGNKEYINEILTISPKMYQKDSKLNSVLTSYFSDIPTNLVDFDKANKIWFEHLDYSYLSTDEIFQIRPKFQPICRILSEMAVQVANSENNSISKNTSSYASIFGIQSYWVNSQKQQNSVERILKLDWKRITEHLNNTVFHGDTIHFSNYQQLMKSSDFEMISKEHSKLSKTPFYNFSRNLNIHFSKDEIKNEFQKYYKPNSPTSYIQIAILMKGVSSNMVFEPAHNNIKNMNLALKEIMSVPEINSIKKFLFEKFIGNETTIGFLANSAFHLSYTLRENPDLHTKYKKETIELIKKIDKKYIEPHKLFNPNWYSKTEELNLLLGKIISSQVESIEIKKGIDAPLIKKTPNRPIKTL